MDRIEALNIFIKSNLKLMLLETFPKETFKRAKIDFFLDSRTNIGVPRDGEIASQALKFLIKNRIVKEKVNLLKIMDLPFFIENVRNREPYLELLIIENQAIKVIDTKALSEAEKLERMKQQLKQEIIKDNSQEIEEAIQQKRDEYLAIPSVIDEEEIIEPDIIPKATIDDEYNVWWKQLRLSDDPFPTQDGLFFIPDSLYERIVFKTEIFQRYISLIKNSSKELYKDAIFFGQFGSGKTTLFDYLKKPLMNQRIFMIVIQLYAEDTFQGLMSKFRKNLFVGLCDLHELIYTDNPQHCMKTNDLQENIEYLLKKLKSDNENVKGIIVVIDNLHKHRDEFDLAMKFITNLQIFKAEIMRKIPDLNLGFYVAGSTDWETIIKNDPKFSGSYMKHEIMPPVTEEAAYEMLNRRLTTFAVSPDTIKPIDLNFVKKIYRGLQNNKEPITFRSFIKASLAEFEKGNFTILTADPIHISKQTLEEIRDVMMSKGILKTRFNNLLFGGGIQREENRRKTIELLVDVFLRKEINEISDKFRENQFGFQRLARAGLIQKVKFGLDRKWVVCKELLDINTYIFKTFNLSLEDYLTKIFISPLGTKKPSEKMINEELTRLDALISHLYDKEACNLAKASREIHTKIITVMDSNDRAVDSPAIVTDCTLSLSLLSKSLAVFLGVQVPVQDDLTFLRTFWKGFWFSPSEITEFINQVSLLKNEDKASRTYYCCIVYRDAFFSIMNFFSEEIDKSRFMMIPIRSLSNNEIEEFHNVRNKLLNHEYFEAVDELSQLTETKLRTFLFNLFNLLYCDRESRLKHVDKETREYILRNLQNDHDRGLSSSSNEFEQLNRGNFKNFVIGVYNKDIGLENWKNVFRYVFSPISENEVKDFLDIFADFNIATSHTKHGAFSGEQQSRVLNYIIRGIDIIKAINNSYILIIQKYHHLVVQPFGSIPKNFFSFSNLADSKYLTPIIIKSSNATRIGEHFLRQQNVNIDLEDKMFIESTYGIDYREFMVILSKLINQNYAEKKRSGIGAEIKETKGSLITLYIQKVQNIQSSNVPKA